MERNVEFVRHSTVLHGAACSLADRCLDLAARLQISESPAFVRAGRKASGLDRAVKKE
jgi:hypothetical protein